MGTDKIRTAQTVLKLLGHKTVLLVDDELLSLMINEAILSDCGWTIYKAANVDQAAEILYRHEIDIVISDFHMPDKTGYDLFHLVQSFKAPPLFALLTAEPKDPVIQNLKSGNSMAVWEKPIEPIQIYLNIIQLFLAYKKPEFGE